LSSSDFDVVVGDLEGPKLAEIQRIGAEIEELLTPLEGTRAVFAERVPQGFYVNITVDRELRLATA
jgi:Cu(I)/Ag(I) efflux system membrane protein CusA/SilA